MELIQKHPILEFHHGKEVTFTFDGKEMKDSRASHSGGAACQRCEDIQGNARDEETERFFCAIGNAARAYGSDEYPTCVPA